MAVNKYLSVSYELYAVEGGEAPVLVEKTGREHCFEFVTGLGFTLPMFENNVKDLAEGDKFDFVIPQDMAYGSYDETKVKELSKDLFRNSGGHFSAETIYPGNVIPMVNEDGMHFDGLVLEVKQDTVVIDFNNELAGMDLHFKGEIVKCHEATAEEISMFVNAMSGGCGCGCGDDCGGGCGGGCNHEHKHGDGGCGGHGGHGDGCCGGHGGHGDHGGCGCGHCH